MADEQTVILLDPTAEDVPEELPIAQRRRLPPWGHGGPAGQHQAQLGPVSSWLGRRAWCSSTGWPKVVHRRKANANSPAPPDLLDDVSSADMVVHAVAD